MKYHWFKTKSSYFEQNPVPLWNLSQQVGVGAQGCGQDSRIKKLESCSWLSGNLIRSHPWRSSNPTYQIYVPWIRKWTLNTENYEVWPTSYVLSNQIFCFVRACRSFHCNLVFETLPYGYGRPVCVNRYWIVRQFSA